LPDAGRGACLQVLLALESLSASSAPTRRCARADRQEVLAYFVAVCHGRGLAAKSYVGFGIDPIEELTTLAETVRGSFPHSIFFTSKLIFEHDNWYIRQLHSAAALTLLRRLHLRNMPMVVLPMKL
jgi:hypothetical protein